MYDSTLARLYVAIGAPGVVCVVDTTRLELLETVPTEPGAHTIGWNSVHYTLYAFLPTSMGVVVFAEQECATG